jgi:hypothetical protein
VPLVRQTRMSVGRRVVRVVVMLRVLILKVMMPPLCMRLHARGGDVEGVQLHVLIPVAVCRGGHCASGEGDAFRCCCGLGTSWRRELPHLANAAQEGRPRTRRFLCSCVRHEVLQ